MPAANVTRLCAMAPLLPAALLLAPLPTPTSVMRYLPATGVVNVALVAVNHWRGVPPDWPAKTVE
jgi:hypothetical protein